MPLIDMVPMDQLVTAVATLGKDVFKFRYGSWEDRSNRELFAAGFDVLSLGAESLRDLFEEMRGALKLGGMANTVAPLPGLPGKTRTSPQRPRRQRDRRTRIGYRGAILPDVPVS